MYGGKLASSVVGVPPTAVDGQGVLTTAGRMAIIANAFLNVDVALTKAQAMLTQSDIPALNGQAVSSVIQLIAVLDMIACHCNTLWPQNDVDQDRFYFRDYRFTNTYETFIHDAQARILKIKWNDETFFAIANKLKHRLPYVGIHQSQANIAHTFFSLTDIWDGENRGFFLNMLIPVYNETREIIVRLNKLMEREEDRVPGMYFRALKRG